MIDTYTPYKKTPPMAGFFVLSRVVLPLDNVVDK